MKKTSIIKKCLVCDRRFKAHQYLLKKGQARYCSLACKGRDQNGRVRILPDKKCEVCNSNFHVQPNQIKTGRNRFCSSDCYHQSTLGKVAYNRGIPMSEKQKVKVSEARRGKNTGEDNPSWKGGVTPVNHIIRESTDYKAWRKTVFERDGYTCQMCGQIGGKLQADHDLPFAVYPDLRFEVLNGQTLCFDCHLTKTKGDRILIREMQLNLA